MTLDSVVKIADGVIFQDLDSEAVLLDMKSEVFFGLDQVGTDIWQLLKTHGHIATVARIIAEDYEAGEDEITEKLLAFTEKLVSKGLVEIARPEL